MKFPEIGALYDHYKGGRYEVMSLAKHTESDETLVIYRSLHFGSVHARPLSMWFELVKLEDGKEVPRFCMVFDHLYPYDLFDDPKKDPFIEQWSRWPSYSRFPSIRKVPTYKYDSYL